MGRWTLSFNELIFHCMPYPVKDTFNFHYRDCRATRSDLNLSWSMSTILFAMLSYLCYVEGAADC